MEEKNIINTFLKDQTSIYQIIIAGVLLNIGIVFLGSGILDLDAININLKFIIGGSFLILSLILFYKMLTKHKIKRINTRGCFLINNKKNELISLPDYEFMNKAYSDLISLKKELPNINITDKKILLEATQYYFLYYLSLHLRILYRTDKKFIGKKFIVLGREDFSKFITNNKFLDVFSTPLVERGVKEAYNHRHILYCLMHENGKTFEYFDFILPKGSKLSMPDNNTILIDNKRMKLTVNFSYGGLSNLLSKDFINYYLGKKEQVTEKITKIHIDIEIEIKLKSYSILTYSNWAYYNWFDSFSNSFINAFSWAKFEEKINWNNNKVLIKVLKNYKEIDLNNEL